MPGLNDVATIVSLTAPVYSNRLFRTVYFWGAMTVQTLRNVVGAHDFHRIVRTWLREYEHAAPASTAAFVALARAHQRPLAWSLLPGLAVHTRAAGADRRQRTPTDTER